MTPEEACAYLDISIDDELNITLLERNYGARISACKNSPERRAKIEEAYNILLGLYRELYEPYQLENQNHESMFMKLAVLLSVIFVVCFAGVIMFMYMLHKDNAVPKKDPELDRNYERILGELDRMKRQQEDMQASKVEPPADYAALVEKVMPSMLFINTNEALGSGFFVSPNGDILTNHHVIDEAEYIVVTTQDGQKYNALVKDYDSQKDMALIKINLQSKSKFLNISSSLPRQGEAVIAIGNPKGLQGSVSNGIVSAIRNENNSTWVQFTAPVSGGSSGGALINLNGEVIGMVTIGSVKEDIQNINFAVAPTVLNQFLRSAINKTAREISRKKETPKRTEPNFKSDSGMKFVRKDELYEMYLYTAEIEYDRRTGIAAFLTFWLPTEKQKEVMRKHPDFNIPYGEDVGVCALFYTVNFKDNKYLHLRTINFSTNDNVIRDYVKPSNEIVWRTPKKNSRIDILMKEVKRQLRID